MPSETFIKRQVEFLVTQTGDPFPLGREVGDFQPTPTFYEMLCAGDLEQAVRILAKHVRATPAPAFRWTSSLTGKSAGRYMRNGPTICFIQVAERYRNKPIALGAILAHEIAHHYLHSRNIELPNENQNECLTDIATVFLGLGKLTLNGYIPVTAFNSATQTSYTQELGYLTAHELAYSMACLVDLGRPPQDDLLEGLIPGAKKALWNVGLPPIPSATEHETPPTDGRSQPHPPNSSCSVLRRLRELPIKLRRAFKRWRYRDVPKRFVSCPYCRRTASVPNLAKYLLVTCPNGACKRSYDVSPQ